MSTAKKGTASPNKAIKAANDNALKGFPKAKVRKAFETMAATANDAEVSNDARQSAALDVCNMARDFSLANQNATVETRVTGWRDNIKVLAMTLAIDGNRFATLTEGKDDKPATAKLTGYGNNVASIAKGVIEFGIDPQETESESAEPSYREVRKSVEGLRAEARRLADPDAARFADTLNDCDDTWQALRTLVADTGDLQNVRSLLATLEGHVADVAAQLVADSDAEADAEAEAEAA